MRMVERRQLALAHEFPRADLDDRDARRIVEMRNDPLGHVFVPHSPAAVRAELLALRRVRHHTHRRQGWLAKSV
jgi:hypothetical protein